MQIPVPYTCTTAHYTYTDVRTLSMATPTPLSPESFGNPTRIDYGTGHEFKFCVFLCCLMKLGVILLTDAAALVLKVFEK